MSKLHDHEKGLGAILGKKVVEVAGYPIAEFGKDTLVFKITRLLFDDGSALYVEGEHDMPYIPNNEEMQATLEPDYTEDCE